MKAVIGKFYKSKRTANNYAKKHNLVVYPVKGGGWVVAKSV